MSFSQQLHLMVDPCYDADPIIISKPKYYKPKSQLVLDYENKISLLRSDDQSWRNLKAKLTGYSKAIGNIPEKYVVCMRSPDARPDDPGNWYAKSNCPDTYIKKYIKPHTYTTKYLAHQIEILDQTLEESVRIMHTNSHEQQLHWVNYIEMVIHIREECINNFWDDNKQRRPFTLKVGSTISPNFYKKLESNKLLPPYKLSIHIMNVQEGE